MADTETLTRVAEQLDRTTDALRSAGRDARATTTAKTADTLRWAASGDAVSASLARQWVR